jgi:hypothetical protein
MTEFKGKDGEGMRDSWAASGILETGGSSPAGRKYRVGALSVLAPSHFFSYMETPYPKSSFPRGKSPS